MKRALELATLGNGHVSPNPMVGCVIVHEGKITGEGWHQQYGSWHAEVNAINDAIAHGFENMLAESTAYVTLEPCAHYGKTPPCTDLLIEKKIKKVVIANQDPNPLVAGKGIEKLRTAGIEVEIGIMEKEGLALNQRFFTFIQQDRPYIILKWAETADGFIADNEKNPLIISGIHAQILNHKWRSEEDAILVGTNTAQHDNPRLSARLWSGRNPVRIVIDRTLRLSSSLNLFDNSQPTLCYNAFKNEQVGNTIFVSLDFNDAFIENLLQDLYTRKIQSLIVEGGAMLLQSFLNENIFDEIRIIKSPKTIIAGTNAPVLPPTIRLASVENIDGDILCSYYQSFTYNRK